MRHGEDLAADLAIRLAGARRDEVNRMIATALGELAELAAAPRSYITLYHDDGTFENVHEWTDGSVVPQLPAIKQLRSDDFAHTYHLVQDHQVFAAHDLMALGPEARAEQTSFAAFGVQAVLQVPIVVDGEGVGLVGFNYWDTVEPWPPELVETVRVVGQVIGGVLIRDRSESSIRRAYEQAEQAMRAKDELLAQLSHELRTPLHAILGFAELLELDDASDADREALFQIQHHGRNLLGMVEDLLALAGGDEPERQDIAVHAMLEPIVEGLARVGEQRSISLSVSHRLDGFTVFSEIPRLRQVLYCVLSGCITALPRGGRITVDRVDGERTDPMIGVDLDGYTGATDEVVTSMARSLIADHGTISVEQTGVDTVRIGLTFDGSV